MVERIACFLTCGYTEAGAMQSFLHKINDRYEFRQYLPNKTIKKKGTPKNISDAINGLTDRKSTRLNSSHMPKSRMPSSA